MPTAKAVRRAVSGVVVLLWKLHNLGATHKDYSPPHRCINSGDARLANTEAFRRGEWHSPLVLGFVIKGRIAIRPYVFSPHRLINV